MTTLLTTSQLQTLPLIKQRIATEIDSMMASLPEIKDLSPEQRRGMIARYTAVLEGNFIYWMTATYLSVKAEEAKPVIIDNLREECGDSHPAMMRRFAIAAHSFPTDTDAFAIQDEMTNVRLFLGRLSGVQNVLTMAYFEGFIQQFMAYLADLAKAQGSTDLEYTDVHGVCDVAHTQGLFVALEAEMKANPPAAGADIFEGVDLLCALVQRIVHSPSAEPIAV